MSGIPIAGISAPPPRTPRESAGLRGTPCRIAMTVRRAARRRARDRRRSCPPAEPLNETVITTLRQRRTVLSPVSADSNSTEARPGRHRTLIHQRADAHHFAACRIEPFHVDTRPLLRLRRIAGAPQVLLEALIPLAVRLRHPAQQTVGKLADLTITHLPAILEIESARGGLPCTNSAPSSMGSAANESWTVKPAELRRCFQAHHFEAGAPQLNGCGESRHAGADHHHIRIPSDSSSGTASTRDSTRGVRKGARLVIFWRIYYYASRVSRTE